jgi:Flp pilus assembly pilin Flp
MGSSFSLFGDTRGAVSVEYIVVVGTVGLLFAAAVAALGPGLIASYETTRSVVASPYP